MSIPRSKLPKSVRESLGEPKMSKLEAAYQSYLHLRCSLCEIVCYQFHPRSFDLDDDCKYSPDFYVCQQGAKDQMVEVKGCHVDKRIKSRRVLRPWYRDSGDRYRLRWAAQLYGDKYDFVIAMQDPKTKEWQHVSINGRRA